MPLTSFGPLLNDSYNAQINSSPRDSDSIAVHKNLVYIMTTPTRIEYVSKDLSSNLGYVDVANPSSSGDDTNNGIVWYKDRLWFLGNDAQIYYWPTGADGKLTTTTATLFGNLSSYLTTGNALQFGFDFKRKLLIAKGNTSNVYYINPENASDKGSYATSAALFAGSTYSSNFFVDKEDYMYLGIGDNPSPDIRILRTTSATLPLTFTSVGDRYSTEGGYGTKGAWSNESSTTGGTGLADGIFPDPWRSDVVYTQNDDQPARLFQINGTLSANFNAAPNAPIGLSPGSASSSTPTSVHTLTPTLTWTFSDPDSGDTQQSFQVQLFNSSGTLIHDSGQISQSTGSYSVPASAALQPNTAYNWTVRTWDASGTAGSYAANVYVKTTSAPTISGLTPGNANAATPDVSSVTPRLSWTYSDPDGDPQTSYQLKIYNPSTSLLVYDSTLITSANNYHNVPSGVLGAGVKYYWFVTVKDSSGMSTTSAYGYILTNMPPASVTLVSPANTYRTTTRPVFVVNIGDDVENDKQHFKLQLAYDMNFTSNLTEFSTQTTTGGWELFNGSSWTAFPSGGADSTFENKQVRYTYQSDLVEGKTWYWRMAPIDGTTGALGTWSSIRTIRVGDTLQFKLKTPMKTTGAANKLLLTGKRQVATDGTTPASFKVEVCNNGLDASPTWEDATNAFLNGLYYSFTNTVKTATDWAVDARVTIKANDSLGAIEFDGFGFTIQ